MIFDYSTAAVGVVVCLPIMLIAALLLKCSEPKAPVFFSQVRVGKNNKLFRVYKFRSMRLNAEKATGPILSQLEDVRITRLGGILRKAHIDELPQFFNVLNGTMSLVGPRPERPFFVRQFRKYIPFYADRFAVKPGITGLAQVYGSYHSKAEEKLIFDLNYIHIFDLWLDVKICIRTVLVAIKKLFNKKYQ